MQPGQPDAGGGLPPGGPFAAIETSIAQLAHDQAPLLPGALSATYESLALLYRRETEPPLDTQTSARVAGCLSSLRAQSTDFNFSGNDAARICTSLLAMDSHAPSEVIVGNALWASVTQLNRNQGSALRTSFDVTKFFDSATKNAERESAAAVAILARLRGGEVTDEALAILRHHAERHKGFLGILSFLLKLHGTASCLRSY
jgi:hypothetical protein